MARHHRLHAVRAHLLQLAGDHDTARAAYREAARRTSSIPEKRYLQSRANARTCSSAASSLRSELTLADDNPAMAQLRDAAAESLAQAHELAAATGRRLAQQAPATAA